MTDKQADRFYADFSGEKPITGKDLIAMQWDAIEHPSQLKAHYTILKLGNCRASVVCLEDPGNDANHHYEIILLGKGDEKLALKRLATPEDPVVKVKSDEEFLKVLNTMKESRVNRMPDKPSAPQFSI